MLGRLFKHEIKATARMFLPIYLILFALAGFTKGIMELDRALDNMLFKSVVGISMALFWISVVGMLYIALVIMVIRFYRHLIKDEGYLSHTLPVKPWQHVLAKLLAGAVWQVTSIAAGVGAVVIYFLNANIWQDIVGFFEGLQEMLSNAGLPVAPLLIALAFSLLSSLLMVFAAMSLGQTSARHKVGMSFLMWLVLYVITQTVSGALTVPLVLIAMPDLENGGMNSMNMIMWFALGLQCMMGTGYFLTASLTLKRKLNLE